MESRGALALAIGQLVSALATAASIALDLAAASEFALGDCVLPWQIIALGGFVAFTVLAAVDRYRLEHALDEHARIRATIDELTDAEAKWRELVKRTPFTLNPLSLEAGVAQNRYEEERAELAARVREILARGYPEFLHEWNAQQNASVISEAIRELRQRP